MAQVDSVFQVIRFIEDNLKSPVDVAAMAAVAPYSLYYFCRIFSKVTRHTPHDYLIRRRITEAAADVIETQARIIDIALDFQFNSHEGFTRAFGRVFGRSPTEARQRKAVPKLRCLPPLTHRHLLCLQAHHYLVPDFVPADIPIGMQDSIHMPLEELATSSPPVNRNVWLLIATQTVLPHDATSPPGPVASATGKGYARFDLVPGVGPDLPLVLDWIMHTWLFYAPYELAAESLLVDHRADVQGYIYVPVERKHPA